MLYSQKKTPSNATLYADAKCASSYNVPDSSLLPVAMAELAVLALVLRLPSDCSSRVSASLARGSTGRLSRPLSEMHSTGCAEAPSVSLCSRPCTASRVATRLPASRRHRSCWGLVGSKLAFDNLTAVRINAAGFFW